MDSHFWKNIPQRTAEWELEAEGRVVVLVPKFRHPLLQRWVLPLLAKPVFRIHLDATGSVFWQLCDGTRTLEEIKTLMQQNLGEQLEPIEERFSTFVHQLQKGNLIHFCNSHNT